MITADEVEAAGVRAAIELLSAFGESAMAIDMNPVYDGARRRFSNPVVITLTRPESQSGGPEESVEVANVQEQAESQGEVDSPMGGSFDAVTRTFHLWAIECQGLTPGIGWLIEQQDGTVWRITEAEPLAHRRRFRCKCVRKQEGH